MYTKIYSKYIPDIDAKIKNIQVVKKICVKSYNPGEGKVLQMIIKFQKNIKYYFNGRKAQKNKQKHHHEHNLQTDDDKGKKIFLIYSLKG